MYIGKLKIKNPILLAPMSGVTDPPYRKIVKKFNPGLVFSEMIASRALVEQNIMLYKLLDVTLKSWVKRQKCAKIMVPI